MSKQNQFQPDKIKSKKSGKKKIPIEGSKKLWWLLAGVLILTIVIYWPSLSNGFVDVDDDRYVQNNQLIRHFNLKTLFTGYCMGNYHPLVMTVYTWIYSFAQLNPEVYHAVSLLIHLFNTSFVLLVIFELTGVVEIAFITGLLFGIHPLHVESVAWISELKDVMYTGFFLASLFCYIKYVKSGFRKKLFFFSLLFFLCSLLSKGMAVSLTAVLLLTDYFLGRKLDKKVFLEKIPFFILSIIFGLVAIDAQKAAGAIKEVVVFSLPQRIVFACYGFLSYLNKLILPVNLSAYYPYPVKAGDNIPALFYFYPIIVFALLITVFWLRKKTSKVLFGIGFYAATVFLVLQLLPVGATIMADRYSYVPSIGIFFLVACALFALFQNASYKNLSIGLLIALTAGYSFLTYQRTQIWKNGMTLWNDVIAKENGNAPIAFINRGVLFKQAGEPKKAMADFQHALMLDPRNVYAWGNIGLLDKEAGELDKALGDFQNSLKLDSGNADVWNQIASIYMQQGFHDKSKQAELFSNALKHINHSLQIDSNFSPAYCNRCILFANMGNNDAAINDCSKAIELNPNFNEAYYYRGIAYYNLAKQVEACNDFRKASILGNTDASNVVGQLCK